MNKTRVEAVKQNLKNLLLTSPGERIFYSDFGCGLFEFLFENSTDATVSEVGSRIVDQVARWMPEVVIESLDVDTRGDNLVAVRLDYYITTVGIQDSVIISTERDVDVIG